MDNLPFQFPREHQPQLVFAPLTDPDVEQSLPAKTRRHSDMSPLRHSVFLYQTELTPVLPHLVPGAVSPSRQRSDRPWTNRLVSMGHETEPFGPLRGSLPPLLRFSSAVPRHHRGRVPAMRKKVAAHRDAAPTLYNRARFR